MPGQAQWLAKAGLGKTPEAARSYLPIAPDVLAAFMHHSWPGNVRQLSSVLQTACALREQHEAQIDWQHLADDVRQQLQATPAQAGNAGAEGHTPRASVDTVSISAAGASLPARTQGLKAWSRQAMQATLDATGGNVSEAARRLGVSRQTLYRQLRAATG